jgi:prepilin-type N-terminal cleavage/methylation domain-containing protein
MSVHSFQSGFCCRGARPVARSDQPSGFTLLELCVALIVLGVALGGLFPLVIRYSKTVSALEGCTPQTGRWHMVSGGDWVYVEPDPTLDLNRKRPDRWYLVPSSDDWARKLGISARVYKDLPATTSSKQTNLALDDDLVHHDVYSEGDSAWISGPSSGYNGGCRYHASNVNQSEASSAIWTFMNVQPGWYEVQATWPPGSVTEPWTHAAHYKIYDTDRSELLAERTDVDQSLAPVGDQYDGRTWTPIATVYVKRYGQTLGRKVEVRLIGESASDYTVADGIRLVYIRADGSVVENTIELKTLRRSLDGKSATADMSLAPLTRRP